MFVKVKSPQLKRPVYLEHARFIERKGHRFVSGFVIKKDGESVLVKGGDVLHLIEIGPGVVVQQMEFDNKYGWLVPAKQETPS